jgi:DNA excision repair protein ERCC-2
MYEVAVRTLCEFTAKRGDLDMRFTPSPSASEGIAGHRLIASRRNPSFQTELTLAAEFGPLQVRGRADGYDPEENRVEEFKTYRGELARIPENHRALHWAQLRIYGWLLCRQKGKSCVKLALVYLDVASEQETVFEEEQTASELERHFAAHCERFISWAESEAAHRRERDEALRDLRFPYPDLHSGQRTLARGVYRRIGAGGALLAQAPTGIGKTAGTLFPALKSMAASQLDKLFYLVPKTSGRQPALDTLRQLQSPKASVRVVELVARGKACEYPGLPCEGSVCPLARGFYDRLPAARAEAMQAGFLDHPTVREIAARHAICPYYLGQEVARWSDVVVGDYNYYFDRTAMLFSWTVTHQWRVALLVDEAHNLVERARAMYTASLDRAELASVAGQIPASAWRDFESVRRAWDELEPSTYRVCDELPAVFLAALDRLVAALGDHLQQHPQRDEALQELFFAALAFSRLAADLDSSTLFEIQQSTLCLRNVVPGRFIGPRFAAAHAAVLFSATLAPHEFFRNILGLPPATEYLDVESPFRAEQLKVRLVRSISTRFRDRERSLAPIADLLGAQYAATPGNYLVFSSSFEYLERLLARVNERCPGIPTWKQHPAMTESDREEFLARFRPDGRGVGFAVLGGAFAEGIDLPGSRLIGAFVATLGLPQINAVNEEMQRRMQALFGAGYAYTYLYPGIQKVVQASGRVIRAPTDRGVLYLIDDRYADPKVLRLLPRWWSLRPTSADQHLSPRPSSAASLSP